LCPCIKLYINQKIIYVAPIQIEIAACGAAASLVDLVRYDEEDDGTITMAIKTLDNLVSEGNIEISQA
jgi:hypothetical protein